MDLALLVARSGLDAHHKSLEVIANNLANAQTAAFKKDRPEFEDLPYLVSKISGSPVTQNLNSPASIAMGTGVRMADNKKIFTQGTEIMSGNTLDLAINGRGFFQVQMANGTDFAYTRDGQFRMNDQGQITTRNGYVVQPPITIPEGAKHIDIAQDGTVMVTDQTNTAQQVGQIQLTDFINPDGLLPIGENLYMETVNSGPGTQGNPTQNSLGSLRQNAYEASNVNIVEEMINMIEAQRAFEVTSKAVSTADQMLQYLNQVT